MTECLPCRARFGATCLLWLVAASAACATPAPAHRVPEPASASHATASASMGVTASAATASRSAAPRMSDAPECAGVTGKERVTALVGIETNGPGGVALRYKRGRPYETGVMVEIDVRTPGARVVEWTTADEGSAFALFGDHCIRIAEASVARVVLEFAPAAHADHE